MSIDLMLTQRVSDLLKGLLSMVKPTRDRRTSGSPTFSPSADRISDSIKREAARSSKVIGLLFSGGPSAVTRLVVSVCINAINRVKRAWGFPHVLQKQWELLPSIAHCNTSTSVQRIFRLVLIGAARAHLAPCPVFLGEWRIRAQAMRARHPNSLSMKTAARLSMSVLQLRDSYFDFIATRAATKPHGSQISRGGVSRLRLLDGQKSAVGFSGCIDWSWHG